MPAQSNQTGPKLMSVGILTSFTASLCCITPVATTLAGAGGLAAALSWIEPIRPYLIGVTVLLLGFAWYQALKPTPEAQCDCQERPPFWKSRWFLGVIAILACLLIAFPLYAGAFFFEQNRDVVHEETDNAETIILSIEGMTCTGCEATVEEAVYGLDGVIEVDANYKTGRATIVLDRARTTSAAVETAVSSTGYTVATRSSNNDGSGTTPRSRHEGTRQHRNDGR